MLPIDDPELVVLDLVPVVRSYNATLHGGHDAQCLLVRFIGHIDEVVLHVLHALLFERSNSPVRRCWNELRNLQLLRLRPVEYIAVLAICLILLVNVRRIGIVRDLPCTDLLRYLRQR